MKAIFLFTMVVVFSTTDLFSQEFKSDERSRLQKEDTYNFYNSDQLTMLDFAQALEMVGISIHKFNLGEFDKEYQILVVADEYLEGSIIKTDTIFWDYNTYFHFEKGNKEPYRAYIDNIKIFTQVKDTAINFIIKTYGLTFTPNLPIKKYSPESFYNFRSYTDFKWSLNDKMPLFIYASSWKDKEGGFQRFCGTVNLSRNDEDTNELLTSSPHYYLFSYFLREE